MERQLSESSGSRNGDEDRSKTIAEHVVQVEYKVYFRRWIVLICVVLLTIANNALWISFASVNSKAAEYFGKTSTEIDLLSTVSFIVGIPFCLISTWVVDRLGLRIAVLISTGFTFAGGTLRMLGTFPPWSETLDPNAQYWICVAAQALTGMGNPIAISLPTKVRRQIYS